MTETSIAPSHDRIILASDHAGLSIKMSVLKFLRDQGFACEDLGPFSDDSVDYPDFAQKVADAISSGRCRRGVLVCGSGVGMSIAANRFLHVRAALCHNEEVARLSRLHNDSNVLVLGGRLTDEAACHRIVRTWIETPFEGGRHARRVAKIDTTAKPNQPMERVTVFDHPLVQHKLTVIRNENCDTKVFREVVDELSALMAYEITRDLPWEYKTVRTPMGMDCAGKVVAGEHIGIVPILRAGLGMIHGILNVLPMAAVGHIGIYRDHDSLKPVEYYCKLPPNPERRTIIVVDPMLATGGSAAAAVDFIKKRGGKHIKFICILAAPEGIEKLVAAHPDVGIYTAGVDERLNDCGYILPGLGDAGDRLFGTK